MIDISVVTVVLNGGETIERAIRSVKSQECGLFHEHIIIDGGSSDNTIQIIEKYDLQFISEKDNGLYDAMNKGIKMCSGRYVLILNSDDWLTENAFVVVENAINNVGEKDIFHGNRIDHFKNGSTRINYFNKSKFRLLYQRMTYNHPTMFVRRDVYNNFLYSTKFPIQADYHWVMRCLRAGTEFCYLSNLFVNYQLGGASTRALQAQITDEGVDLRKDLKFGELKIFVFRCVRLLKQGFDNFRVKYE